MPRFVQNFMDGAPDIESAIRAYVQAVKSGAYPAPEHCFGSQAAPSAISGAKAGDRVPLPTSRPKV